MKVIHVIPISRGILLDRLSYFTAQEVSIGKTVLVPLRKKMIHALVVGVEHVSDIKSDLKSSTYALRKMEHVEINDFLSPEFINSTQQTADYFATSTGSVLNALIPKSLLINLNSIEMSEKDSTEKKNAVSERTPRATNTSAEQLVLQADDEERFVSYKSLIREEFAQHVSVFMCLPTIEDIKKAQQMLEKGIEQYTYVFHSGLTKKELVTRWNKLQTETHPVLIIATGQYLCIPQKHIGTIILEREGSRAYKLPIRPFLDMRTFVSIYAKNIRARLILGDMLLRTETIWKLKNDEYVELSPLKFRSETSAEHIIIDTRNSDTAEGENKTFQVLSKEVKRLIEWNKERSENLFIFAVRKGLAPLTLCGDCGTVTVCSTCSSPVVLHGGTHAEEERYFECHTCGKRRDAKELCGHCGSWKLVTLGVGIELIEKEIKATFPHVKTFRLDAHSSTTHKKALDVVTKFYNTPGSILIGTEMALLYLNKHIENAAVASIDALFSLPDFRVGEKILSILLKIRSLAKENFVLQTRNPEEKIFDYAMKGNLADFYRDEIEERRSFGYPPFSTFIKITLQGEEKAVEKEMEKLPALFEPYETTLFPAFTSTVRGKYVMHALIKIPHGEWVNTHILATLRSLPPQFMIKVDPESIL